ncbi:MAG: ATP-binding cassette domain-containing protein [Mycoplasmatales bacterium]
MKIKMENVSKKYFDKTILDDINLEIVGPKFVLVKGKSGCGKTTLIKLLSSYDKKFEGAILVNELNTRKYSQKIRRNEIAFVFQDAFLEEHLTVIENIEIANKYSKRSKAELETMLSSVGLTGYEKKIVHQLSGGEQQRVGIVRALTKPSSLIICDEPTANLDEENEAIILEHLKEIAKEKLVIVVSHNQIVENYADEIYIIEGGTIKLKTV